MLPRARFKRLVSPPVARSAIGFLRWRVMNLAAPEGSTGDRYDSPMPTVLVVDDDDIVRDVVVRYLELEGFQAQQAGAGEVAQASIERRPPDLVVLDVMLPHIGGLELCQWICSTSSVPVILLTARGEESDRIVGLELGADDYVVKPFSPRELVTRVKTVLRRASQGHTDSREMRGPARPGRLRAGDLEVDGTAREVTLDGRSVPLTATEFDLLWCLASHPRVVMSRAQLLARVWRYDTALDAGTSTVTVHVRRLHEKIEDDPSAPKRIITVWGVGYRFEP